MEPLDETLIEEKEEPGVKYDGGKLRYSLIPYEPLKEVVLVLTFGAKKYAPDNWKKVSFAKERYLDASYRHIEDWRSGQLIDSESGASHLAHAICNLMFLLWFEIIARKCV